MLCGDAQLQAWSMMTPAMRNADHARHHFFGDLDGDFHLASARVDRGEIAVAQLTARGIARMHEQCAALWTFDEALGVVQPRVVGTWIAAPDEQEVGIALGGVGLEVIVKSLEIGDERDGHEVDSLVGCLQSSGQARFEGPEVDAVLAL